MKDIILGGAIVSIVESFAKCEHCKTKIAIDEIEGRWLKSKSGFLKYMCKKCAGKSGVTCNYKGDFVSYPLTEKRIKK